MLDNLDAKRAAFAAQVQAALNPQGLIPHAAVAGLLATRDTYASFMQTDVNAAGSTMDIPDLDRYWTTTTLDDPRFRHHGNNTPAWN